MKQLDMIAVAIDKDEAAIFIRVFEYFFENAKTVERIHGDYSFYAHVCHEADRKWGDELAEL